MDGIVGMRQNGEVGDAMADSVLGINRINNTLGPPYDAVLAKARALTGNASLMLADLTDSQINNGLLNGTATPVQIAEIKQVLISNERVIIAVRAEIGSLPAVNE